MADIPQPPLESFHTVASYELDSFGHVNNSVFLNYLEKARCDFMTQKGLHFNQFFTWRLFPVVRRAELHYKWPAKSGDVLHIKGKIVAYTATSFTLQYEIINQTNGKITLTGETFHVFVNDNNRPSRIPDEFFNRFIKSHSHPAPGDS